METRWDLKILLQTVFFFYYYRN